MRGATKVPVGYVVVKIIHCNDSENGELHNELESIEFTEILSLLRGAVFPLTLEFAAPKGTYFIGDAGSKIENRKSNRNASSGTTNIDDESSDSDDCLRVGMSKPSQILSTLVSLDDAATFAKHATTKLRGCLVLWGYQAATLAVDAAIQVKELRDDRQCKLKDKPQDQDGGYQSDMKSEKFSAEDGRANEEVFLMDNILDPP